MLKHSEADYPVEGAKNHPKIHKQQGLYRIPAAPSSKYNNDGTDNRMTTRQLTINIATSNGHIIWKGVMDIPDHQSQKESHNKESMMVTHHFTATHH